MDLMKTVWKIFVWIVKLACIAALIIVVAGIGSLVYVSAIGACPTLNEGGIRCVTPAYQSVAEYGMTVLLLTVFTGIPGLMAIGGMIFLVRDLMAWRRRRRIRAASR